MPAREQEEKKMSLWAKMSRVLELGLHTVIHSPVQKWHRDLVLITGTLLGPANYLRAVTIHQHSLKKLPEFSPPSPNGEFPWFLETLFPPHQMTSGLLMLCWNKLLLNYRLLHWPQLCPEYQQLLLMLSRGGRGRRFSNGCLLFVLWSKLPLRQRKKSWEVVKSTGQWT